MPLGSTYWRNITVSTSFLCQNDADYWWLDSCLTPWQYLFWWFDQESHWWTYWLNDTLVPHFKHMISWRRPGDKPLSEPVMVSWLTHIYVTRPHWVNYGADRWRIIVLQVTISKELFFVSSIRDNEFTHAISKQRELILAYKKCQNNDIWLGHRLDQRAPLHVPSKVKHRRTQRPFELNIPDDIFGHSGHAAISSGIGCQTPRHALTH